MKKRFLVTRFTSIANILISMGLIVGSVFLSIYLYNDAIKLTSILAICFLFLFSITYTIFAITFTQISEVSDKGVSIMSIKKGKRFYSWDEIEEVEIVRTNFTMWICFYRSKLNMIDKQLYENSITIGYTKRALKEVEKYYTKEIEERKLY